MAIELPPTSAYYGLAEYDRADYGVVHADVVTPALPAYRSGLYVLEPRIRVSDRDNGPGPDITRHVTEAGVDADIDRAGPKGRLTLATTRPELVPVTTWIAPYQRIVPETGDIVDAQMGLYELGEPEITYDGAGHAVATTSGEDIIALPDRSVLTEAEATLPNTVVMADVRAAIERSTLTITGADMVSNGRFSSGMAGWSVGSDSSGFVGSDGVITSASYPPGPSVWSALFDPASPVGSYRWVQSSTMPVTPGTTSYLVQMWVYAEAGLDVRIGIRYPGSAQEFGYSGWWSKPEYTQRWYRYQGVVTVPDDADGARVLVYARATATGASKRVYLGAISMRPVIGTPIRRIALPYDQRISSSRIAHGANTRWLERINDLLAAIGHHALHATLDGQLTSRPLRDPRTDTPTRTYTFGRDSRLVDDVRVRRSTGNVYNTIVAVKEDHATGTALVAVARNDDPDHPWSTVNRGPIAPREPIMASDAVDQSALQALANDRLSRASMQEDLAIAVLPDPALTAYDVIEIAGTNGAAAGRWAVESIAWGLTADDPLVRIGARRTVTSREVS